MARSEYFDEYGKFLDFWGTGSPITQRVIDRSVYQDIVARSKARPGAPAMSEDAVEAKLTAAPTCQKLKIQQNGASVISSLVQAAQATRKEQGAYITYRFSTGDLGYLIAQPSASTGSSEKHFTFPIDVRRSDQVVLAPNTALQVVATVHTHYPDIEAMNRANPGHRYSVSPVVSPEDMLSASTAKIVVYAVDAQFVHKALPLGLPQNKLPRNLDILSDALYSYSRA